MTTTLIQHPQPAGSSPCLKFLNPKAKIMALDTIKTKNHKPFPFTSPTITPHNPPTGALILEIIFSSDNVSSPGTNQTHKEEEGDEEGDNNGDSDEEDVDNGSNSDSHSHHSGSDEDEEEDEEDEDDAEDSDEDSEEEDCDDDGEQQFDDEDFGNEFDKDLIIDFGSASENEEDQLVIDFEDTNINNSPPSSPKTLVTPVNKIPFWFTHEEPGMTNAVMLHIKVFTAIQIKYA